MARTEIVSVGYEGRTPDELVAILRRCLVSHLFDVRELPSSRIAGFSKTPLSARLADAGIVYSHRRDVGNPYRKLGGKRALAMYRRSIGRKSKAKALESLVTEIVGRRVAFLCFERDPVHCHRSILLEMLQSRGLAAKVRTIE